MTSEHATRARRDKTPAGTEVRSSGRHGQESVGDRGQPWAGRRLVLTGIIVVLVALGLIMIGMAARSVSEQRGAGVESRPLAGGAPSAATADPKPPADPTPADDDPTSKPVAGASRRAADPVDITIPRIGVKTSVMKLGLAADRTVEVPPYDRADDVGWYTKSPIPGATGPSVLIGHVDSPDGPAVFARMAQLDAGDKVSVKRSDGSTAVFSIKRVETFAKDDFPTQKVYGDTDHPELRLITCGGTYDRGAGGYQANTIAFADLVSIKHAQQ
ncbi:class F sortase [Microlunatus soli]|uniref:Sortase family protein n=1 Tax=Microlunatus soli TaxID=630515 RepID=A0A1H1M537_9ACTN|nr:class F sortase [Microlunatus soli]SDR81903.1 Sortase family protein [Microlunatus soli]